MHVDEFGVTEQEGRPVYFVRDNGAGFDIGIDSSKQMTGICLKIWLVWSMA